MGKSFMCVKVNTLTVVFYDIFKGSRIAFGIVWCEKMSDVSDAACFIVQLKGKCIYIVKRVKKSYSLSLSSLLV